MTEEVSLLRKITQPSTISMRDVLSVMFRQRRLVVLCFAAIFLSALLYGWLAPSYHAQMKFLVRKGRFDPLITPAPTPSPTFERGDISEEDLNSEVALLHNEDILRAVVRTTGLANATGMLDRLRGDSDEVRVQRAVRRLSQRLKAEPVRKTNLISFSYASSEPLQAERVLRNLANAYLERLREKGVRSAHASSREHRVTQPLLVVHEHDVAPTAKLATMVIAAQRAEMTATALAEAPA